MIITKKTSAASHSLEPYRSCRVYSYTVIVAATVSDTVAVNLKSLRATAASSCHRRRTDGRERMPISALGGRGGRPARDRLVLRSVR